MEFWDLGLSESNFRFLDKETNFELEISKLISEQERNKKGLEIGNSNYDEVDAEIARLIQNFEEEEKQRWEQGMLCNRYVKIVPNDAPCWFFTF